MLVGITERGDAALSDDWAEWVVGMAMQGEKRFPADVIFSKTNDGYYADIV